MHLGLKRVALFFVIITENGASELLDLPDDVPRLVVADVLHDIFQNPLQHDVGVGQIVYQTVNGLFLNLYIVQTDSQIGCEVELASQIAQHALEEGVNSLYAEIVVVMEQQVQGLASTFADLCFRQSRLADNVCKIVAGVG